MMRPMRYAVCLGLALSLGACAVCDDIAARERDGVRASAACEVDSDCRVIGAEGCHVLCGVAISVDADEAAVVAGLRGIRSDAESRGCSCPVADCVPLADLSARCVAGVCEIR